MSLFPSFGSLDAELGAMIMAEERNAPVEVKGKEEALEALVWLVRMATQAELPKRKEEEAPRQCEEVDEESESSHVPDNLPPRPSELCDCHGTVVCATSAVPQPPEEHKVMMRGTCSVCMDDIAVTEKRAFHAQGCHLSLCDDCLADSLGFMISNGNVDGIRCPCCHYYILPREVNERCGPKEREQYHTFLLRKMLGSMNNVHECPNPGCGNAVIADGECDASNWECEACAERCAFCKGPAHPRGQRCEASRNFARAEVRYRVWAAFSVSKRCPNRDCRQIIIKKGGCPHMRCTNCQHEFCWHCKRDWKTHGVCPFVKVALGGLILISPAIAAVMAAGVAVVCVPFFAAQPVMAALAMDDGYDGWKVVRKVWRLGRKMIRNL